MDRVKVFDAMAEACESFADRKHVYGDLRGQFISNAITYILAKKLHVRYDPSRGIPVTGFLKKYLIGILRETRDCEV